MEKVELNFEIISFPYSDKEKFAECRAIREQVFMIEQVVDEDEEFDEFEKDSIHYLISVNNKAVGTARWREIGDNVKLERFAIYKEYRNKGLGIKLVNKVTEDASELGKKLYMHAQLKAIPLYKRAGFTQVGEMFSECNIDHFKMEKKVN